MPKPKYETWFMGKLIKDFHYIEVEDDFSIKWVMSSNFSLSFR